MQNIVIQNPILPGFNPDPSICKVDDDFYIACSTFEWFPGIVIYHSKNLRDWTIIARPLNRSSQLHLTGYECSAGVFAPCLSYNLTNKTFYLVYTLTKGGIGGKPNYLVTTKNVRGAWSDPIHLNSTGIDPSLFHDDDGRAYLVNQLRDYRMKGFPSAGIILQEFNYETLQLKGKIHHIFKGTEVGVTEGPHLYKRNNWYYLVVAEGGISYGHQAVIARSRTINGEYTLLEQNPLLCSITKEEREKYIPIRKKIKDPCVETDINLPAHWYTYPQKAGHVSLCALSEKEWIMVYLSARPMHGTAHCPLGRETSIQRVYWDNDCLYTYDQMPTNTVVLPQSLIPQTTNTPDYNTRTHSFIDNFDNDTINEEFLFLREKLDKSNVIIDSKHSKLRMYGDMAPDSNFTQSIIACRVRSFNFKAKTCVDIAPHSYFHFAGIFIRYNDENQILLRISLADDGSRSLGIMQFDHGELILPIESDENNIEISIPNGEIELQVEMKVDKSNRRIIFYWGQDGTLIKIPYDFDPAKYSDDYIARAFTGMMVGIGCFDLSGKNGYADFKYFQYLD